MGSDCERPFVISHYRVQSPQTFWELRPRQTLALSIAVPWWNSYLDLCGAIKLTIEFFLPWNPHVQKSGGTF